jgi:hypothetical protein
MRLFDCRDHLVTLSEEEFLSALAMIESYVLRRGALNSACSALAFVHAIETWVVLALSPTSVRALGGDKKRDTWRFRE